MTNGSGSRWLVAAVVALCLFVAVGSARADTVVMRDGSNLVGEVVLISGEGVRLRTAYAGELMLPRDQVAGVSTDGPIVVALESGERYVGRLTYADESQMVTGTGAGDVAIELGSVAASWRPGAAGEAEVPEVVREEVEQLKAAHERELEELREEVERVKAKWSGSIAFSLDGETGNTEEFSYGGDLRVRRETDTDRLIFYAYGQYSEENGEQSDNEIIGGARYEVDLDERWFAYGRFQLEHDEFENLSLRVDVAGGVGYFLIREPKQEWSLRGGVGYRHESFFDAEDQDSAFLDLGWDYWVEIAQDLRFTHIFRYEPAFDDFAGDYLITSDAAVEVPLGESDWRLRGGLRNEYDASPVPGVERLDTTYYLQIVYSW